MTIDDNIGRMVSAVLPMVVVTVVSPAVASADSGLREPTAQFSVSAPGAVTAQVHNPNAEGVCWAIHLDSGRVFHGATGVSLAHAGESVTVALRGIAPGETHCAAVCWYDYPVPAHTYDVASTDTVTLTVPEGLLPHVLSGSARSNSVARALDTEVTTVVPGRARLRWVGTSRADRTARAAR